MTTLGNKATRNAAFMESSCGGRVIGVRITSTVSEGNTTTMLTFIRSDNLYWLSERKQPLSVVGFGKAVQAILAASVLEENR
jgi:hypothetical protein